MKKLIFLFIAMLASYAVIAQTGSAKTDTTQKAAYACPMHPEVTSTKKNTKCSKCGMDLVEVKAKKS